MKSYKQILRFRMERLKERLGSSLTYEKLAEACGIQKTYLSRVFNDEKTHLSGDQLYVALKFLGLEGEDKVFVEALWEFERAALHERREELRKKLEILIAKNQKSEKVLEAEKVTPEALDQQEFYLDPFQPLVLTFLTIPRFRNHPESIPRKLGISQSRFNAIIKNLTRLGFVKKKGDSLIATELRSHLKPDSNLYLPYRALMRMRALDLMQRKTQDESYGFSVLFTGNENTRKKIQTLFLEFLKSAEAESQKGSQDEVFQMNFDLLNWTD